MTTEAFAVAFREYQAALKGLAERSKNSAPQDLPETWPVPEEEPGAEIEELPPAPVVSAKPKSLLLDWAALGAIGLALTSGIYFAGTYGISLGGLAAGPSSAPRPGMSAPTEPAALIK